MIRIVVKTEDSVHVACGGASTATATIKTFDVELPEIEAYLNEPIEQKWQYATRQIIGYEIRKEGK